MVITTPKHKGDQEGDNCYPKHVYANPVKPATCPILSMALLIFGDGWQRSGAEHMLFRDTATEGRRSKLLKGIMTSNGAWKPRCPKRLPTLGNRFGYRLRQRINDFIGNYCF